MQDRNNEAPSQEHGQLHQPEVDSGIRAPQPDHAPTEPVAGQPGPGAIPWSVPHDVLGGRHSRALRCGEPQIRAATSKGER
jgi:hypothetical protein